MSTYLVLDALFLLPCLILHLFTWRRRPRWHALALVVTLVVLVALTVVFDSLMIAAGLFSYAEDRISGVRLWLAPVEDLAYPVAAALLGTALWNLGRDAPAVVADPEEEGR